MKYELGDLEFETSSTIKFHSKLSFTYTNWKGETEPRRAMLTNLYFGVSYFHKTPGWIFVGFDLDKKAVRQYELSKMTDVKEIDE
jgi:hypothetical protein